MLMLEASLVGEIAYVQIYYARFMWLSTLFPTNLTLISPDYKVNSERGKTDEFGPGQARRAGDVIGLSLQV